MELINKHYQEAKESKDPEIINNFLMELSKNPKKEYLPFLDFFMSKLEKQVFEKVKLNLIYVLGEIGDQSQLSSDYFQFFDNTYYTSDRWVRNEIIQSIEKCSKKSIMDSNTIELIGNAVKDDYFPIKINTLKIIMNLKNLPPLILNNLFHVLNSKNPEIIEMCGRILEKFSLDPNILFNALSNFDNYKILKPRAVRALLLIQFKSIYNLELFRELVLNSQWDKNFKDNFLNSIDTYQRILAKNL